MSGVALLDVNALLALIDADHQDADRVHEWFSTQSVDGWATCAITENGFARILSQPRYPRPKTAADAVAILARARSVSGHHFWTCDVSLLNQSSVDRSRLLGPSQITDAYLLALAVAHDGRLVTLDRAVPLTAVPGATQNHLVVL